MPWLLAAKKISSMAFVVLTNVAPNIVFSAETPWKYMHNSTNGAKYMKPSTLQIYSDGSGGQVEVMFDLLNSEMVQQSGEQKVISSIIAVEHYNCQDLSITRSHVRGYAAGMGTGREVFETWGYGKPVRLTPSDWNTRRLDMFCQKKRFYEIWK